MIVTNSQYPGSVLTVSQIVTHNVCMVWYWELAQMSKAMRVSTEILRVINNTNRQLFPFPSVNPGMMFPFKMVCALKIVQNNVGIKGSTIHLPQWFCHETQNILAWTSNDKPHESFLCDMFNLLKSDIIK